MQTSEKTAASISVLILTLNEEKHIERCVRSLLPFATEIHIIDSFSTDRTVEIAKSLGARVLQNKFVNYAQQFQWGLDNAALAGEWVMRMDADEYVDLDLAEAITKTVPVLDPEVVGINLKRKFVFMNRWIRYGGRYPVVLLRLWRRGHGRIENRWMDEHIIVWGGKTISVEGGLTDENLNDISYFTEKHNRYATREAIDVLNQRLGFLARDIDLNVEDGSGQAARRRSMKEKVYNRIPFQVNALLYFLFRYVIQRGFLDGKEGLIYHILQGFWYRFLVGAKIVELERSIAGLSDKDEIRRVLRDKTGLDIN